MDRYGILKATHRNLPEWISWADTATDRTIKDLSSGDGWDYFVRDFLLRRIVASTRGLLN
jgi:hypothetical protein